MNEPWRPGRVDRSQVCIGRGLTPAARHGSSLILLVLLAILIAVFGAEDSPGGDNDSSRLAVVECLVHHDTLSIDQSKCVDVWIDKVYVRGRFYSDKPPVQPVLMACIYKLLHETTGLDARQNVGLWCYLMTLLSSGVAYVVAVVFFYRFMGVLELSSTWRLATTLSFMLATPAIAYVSHVNAHIVGLAVAVVMFERLAVLHKLPADRPPEVIPCVVLGLLGGFSYALEQATGGLLLGGVGLFLLLRWGKIVPVVGYVLGALPWLVLHHAILFSIAGTTKPINSLPEHFDYPGSSFSAANMTGKYNHPTVWHFLAYSCGLLFGNRGIIQSSLPLFLVFPAVFLLWWKRKLDLLGLFAIGWGVLTWLTYAALSIDYSGSCTSVRWFIPHLVAGYYLVALLIRDHPRFRVDFLILSAWGVVLGGIMWWHGSWCPGLPNFWWVQAGALATYLLCSPNVRSLVRWT